MKVYTKIEYEWDGEKLIEVSSDSYEYEGEVAEAKGGSSAPTNTTTVQKQEPWDAAKPYYERLYSKAESEVNDPMSYYPGQTIANQTANQLASQQMITDYATNTAQPMMNLGLSNTTDILSGKYLDPSTNPYLAKNVGYAVGDVINQFTTEALPAIRSGAGSAGGYGGTRQALAEGKAFDSALNNAMRTASQMYGDNYNTQFQNMMATQANLPSYLQAAAVPAQMIGDVGAQQQAYQQDLINDAVARHNFAQEQDWANIQNLSAVLNGGNFYSMSGSQASPGLSSNPFTTAAGIGMMAGGLLG
jgi:hypothetical protein